MSIPTPSFTSFPDFESAEPSTSKRVNETEKKKRSKEHRRHRSRSRSPKGSKHKSEREKERGERRRDRATDKEDDRRKRREERHRYERRDDTQPVSSVPDESHRFFMVDTKPDKLNFQYGGLHQGDIPKYNMIGGGRRVLGLSSAFVVVRRLGKGIEIGISSGSKLSGITDSRTRSLLALPARRLVGGQPDKFPEVDGFIRLPTRRGKSGPEDTYRSITRAEDGDSSASGSNDDLSGEDEDSQDEYVIPETSLQAYLRTLERRLDAQPDSVETWIDLLNRTLSTVPITSKNATRARSDITISLLSRALVAHPSNASSRVLLLKYLKAGEDIWQADQLLQEWEKALKVGGVEIWMEWLEWRSRQTKGGLEAFIQDIFRALAAFGHSEEDQYAKMRIMWRAVVAIRNAGFVERSLAILQAQAELTFNKPPALSQAPFEKQLDELEDFWESEVSRVGEDGGKGWKAWYEVGKPEWATGHLATQPACDRFDLDAYRQWAAREQANDRLYSLPSRTSGSNSDEIDPYSTILFTDIRPLLVNLESQNTKYAFRLVFLACLGLHLPGLVQTLAPGNIVNWDDRWALSELVDPAHLQSIFPQEDQRRAALTDSVSGVIVAKEKEYNYAFGSIKEWKFDAFQPLDVEMVQGKGAKARLRLWSSVDVSDVDVQLVRRVFSQLRMGDEDFTWDALALSFEAALNIKSALKLSKAFLSLPRETLEYWTAHAQLERINGKLDGARKVYQTVLIASKAQKSKAGYSQMWWNWAEMEWLAGQDEQALNVILQLTGIKATNQIGILRARQGLQELIDSASTPLDEENYAKTYALLELLRGEGVTSILSLFDAHIEKAADALARQRRITSSLLFLYHYRILLNNPMPPALLRDRATKALEEYPNNSVLLGLFLEAEKGQGIWGRVRKMIDGVDGSEKDVIRVMQEVWMGGWEKGRWAGEIERIRSGLAEAVEHERTRASGTVWRTYLEHEIRSGQLRGAKKLLFRAIGECPYVKELYLVAFGPLRSVFDGRELQSLVDLMAERGLRLRRELEVMMEEGMKEEDEGELDEIEYNAQEYRRLLPMQ